MTLKNLGFNTVVIPWYRPYAPEGPWWEAEEELEVVRTAVTTARKRGLLVFFWLHTGVNSQDVAEFGGSRTVNAAGKEGLAFCPIDPDFWEKYLIPIGVAEAQIPGTDGVLFELEVYAGGAYDRLQSCYCERCLRRFYEAKEVTDLPIPQPDQRKAFLDEKGLSKTLWDWQESEIRGRAAQFRQALRAVNPNVRFGYYVGPMSVENWFHKGISQGLYDGETPIVNMDQETYGGIGINWDLQGKKYTLWDWEKFQQGLFAAWDVQADIAHGIMLDDAVSNFSPKEAERFCFICAVTGGGYWIYNQMVDPTPFYQSFSSASFKADWALRDPDGFVDYMADRVTIRKAEGFDTTWSDGQIVRAEQLLADGDPQMATVSAFQAEWELRR